MSSFAIIADDLSSATDCGAQVVRSGLSVVVPFGGDLPPAQVISMDTDSRSLPAGEAYARVKAVSQRLAASGRRHFFKSVDSTLRGNLGAEIEAVLDVVQPDCAIIAPAFPKYGRTTVEGVQYLHGRPLHETEFGSDPTAPVRDADIARRLAEGSARKAGRLTLEQVRAGAARIQSAVRELRDGGLELVIVDIARQEDLQQICLGLSESDLHLVWVGSTGLAEFVPLAWNAASAPGPAGETRPPDARPALALVGSASETTRQQLEVARAGSGLRVVSLDAARMIQGDSAGDPLEEATANLRAALDTGHDAALAVRASREEIAATQRLGAALGLSPAQVALQIAGGLAQIGRSLAREGRLSGIVATGGDTANALCHALGAQALELLGEVEAGIPILRVLGECSLPLVTKAGGFGSPGAMADALVKVKHYA